VDGVGAQDTKQPEHCACTGMTQLTGLLVQQGSCLLDQVCLRHMPPCSPLLPVLLPFLALLRTKKSICTGGTASHGTHCEKQHRAAHSLCCS